MTIRHQLGPLGRLAVVLALGCGAILLTLTILREQPDPTDPRGVDATFFDATSPDAVDAGAALRAARSYLDGDELPKAEAILAVLIVRALRSVEARELFGQTLLRKAVGLAARGDEAGAAAARVEAYGHYRLATELGRDSAGLEHAAGVVAVTAGDDDAALRHFRAAARIDPTSPQYPLYAAQVLMGRGAHDEAAAALDRALRLDADEPLVHASLCHLALARDQHDAALGHVHEARAIAPADLRFRVLEAKVHRRRGEPGRGVDLLASLPRAERVGEAVADELARCHDAAGDHGAAAAVWIERFHDGPQDATMWRSAVRAGDALHRAGRPTRAREWLERARLLAGETAEVRALEAALAE